MVYRVARVVESDTDLYTDSDEGMGTFAIS